MKSFKVPAQNATAEFTEKKSRFIGNIYKVESAEQCGEIIKSTQKRFWDASHNVWAWVLEGGVMRFSDDGEPQGTAGMPTLEVLKKAEVMNVLCVTTRYFGGTLLGSGGLVRAYGQACKMALEAAGIAVMTPFATARLTCPYTFLEPIRKRYDAFEAEETNAQYEVDVTIDMILPEEKLPLFREQIVELTSGRVDVIKTGQKMSAKKSG